MKEQILAILEEVAPAVDFTASDTLADDGLIDSFTVVNIIAELSIAFGVNVPFEEVTNKNFNSVDAMVELVRRLQKK